MFGLDPDPFDVAEGRGEHSRTHDKTYGGDDPGINSIFLIRLQVIKPGGVFAHNFFL